MNQSTKPIKSKEVKSNNFCYRTLKGDNKMGSNSEWSNITLTILKNSYIDREYQKLFRILGSPIIFSSTVCRILFQLSDKKNKKRGRKDTKVFHNFARVLANLKSKKKS